ncbi:MAG: LPS-assembly protein LptD [Treponemataceae bacterium]|nr:MAG: LPS-assembly protein LptD [Treponemataceae bacterium]
MRLFLPEMCKFQSKKNGTTTLIHADKINYNREKKLLYAEGNISLTRKKASASEEKLTANTLLFNVDTNEGIFDGARIEAMEALGGSSSSGGTSSMIVSSDVFGRDKQDTIVFKDGSLTFCDDENPHWQIRASRIWLLPGEEFAFLNALLYVGKIPVMYLPAFWYPKDEIIFNPVSGNEPRRGYFINTTTYILGRKALAKAEEDELFSFMRPSKLKKQKLEGIVLHNTNDDETKTYPHMLKVMLDYYSTLGWMAGLDSKFAPKKVFSSIDFSLYLGFSDTIFPAVAADGSSYSGFYTKYSYPEGKSYRDESNFLGVKLPFRYQSNVNLSMTKPFSLTLRMPIYSDSQFETDFFNRKESIDWLSKITDAIGKGGVEKTDSSSTVSEISSFAWSLTTGIPLPLGALKPYANISSLSTSSQIMFASATLPNSYFDTYTHYLNSPVQRFFYPSSIIAVNASMPISGTVFTYPLTKSAKKYPIAPAGITAPDDIKPPKDEKPEAAAPTADGNSLLGDGTPSASGVPGAPALPGAALPGAGLPAFGGAGVTDEKEASLLPDASFPVMMPAIISPKVNFSPLTATVSYSISPTFTQTLNYLAPSSPEDFDWNDISTSQLYVSAPTNLTGTLAYMGGFVSLTNVFAFSPVYQKHPTIKVDGTTITPTSRVRTLHNDYNTQKLDLSLTNTVSVRPFINTVHFSTSNISWNTSVRLVRTEYTGFINDYTDPLQTWKYHTPKWDDTSITAHSLSAAFIAVEDDFSQSLTVSSTLAPRLEHYNASLALAFPFNITASASSGVGHVTKTTKKWTFDALSQNFAVSLFDKKLTLSEAFSYDIEKKHPSSLSTYISGYGLTASYTMLYTMGVNVAQNAGGQWESKSDNDERFRPAAFNLAYTGEKKFYGWKDRITFTPGVTTNIYFDLIRQMSSYFALSPKITFSIYKMLDISFSTSIRNNVIYRYFNFDEKLPVPSTAATNPFVDIFYSLSFWDINKMRASPFKLQSFSVTLTHSLHDWDMNASLTLTPRVVGGQAVLDYNKLVELTVGIVWRPLKSIKTTIKDKYGDFILNPQGTT